MFELDQSPTYLYPVELELETDAGPVKAGFTAEFARLPANEVEDLLKQGGEFKVTDREVIDRVLRGWRDITRQGEPVPYTPENLERVLAMHPAKRQIVVAWIESVTRGRRKN